MPNAHESQPHNIYTNILLPYFVGPFLLTNLLLDKMKITAKETDKEGRIVIVSSYAHFWAPKEGIIFDKLNGKTRLARKKTKPSFHENFHRFSWEI
jgi:NAD(P)-dependent dehydrogenase (short-subunit alcohol dehydrogenase family)